MTTRLRSALPLLAVALGQLAFLAHGAMLGCGFQASPAATMPDDMDNPRSRR